MKFNEIFQLGVVVRNLEAAVEIYTDELGYGPFEMGDGAFFADKVINGEIGPGLPMKTATYRSGTYEIELMDISMNQNFLDELRCRNGNLEILLAEKMEGADAL